MAYSDPDKQKAYLKEYRNRPGKAEAANKRAREVKDRKKQMVVEHMTPCKFCGAFDPDFMDFHHINPSDKSDSISNLLRHRRRNSVILEEIKKCVCLCSNCHRKLHAGSLTLDLE